MSQLNQTWQQSTGQSFLSSSSSSSRESNSSERQIEEKIHSPPVQPPSFRREPELNISFNYSDSEDEDDASQLEKLKRVGQEHQENLIEHPQPQLNPSSYTLPFAEDPFQQYMLSALQGRDTSGYTAPFSNNNNPSTNQYPSTLHSQGSGGQYPTPTPSYGGYNYPPPPSDYGNPPPSYNPIGRGDPRDDFRQQNTRQDPRGRDLRSDNDSYRDPRNDYRPPPPSYGNPGGHPSMPPPPDQYGPYSGNPYQGNPPPMDNRPPPPQSRGGDPRDPRNRDNSSKDPRNREEPNSRDPRSSNTDSGDEIEYKYPIQGNTIIFIFYLFYTNFVISVLYNSLCWKIRKGIK